MAIGADAEWRSALRDEPPVVVTGVAGFIGFHLAAALLDAGLAVVGLDSLSPYYDVALKRARLAELSRRRGFRFRETDLSDRAATEAAFSEAAPRRVAHLAAQAGVRHSIEAPHDYADSNLVGFLNVLEACRTLRTAHLVYASSSSVYGGNAKLPYAVANGADHPVSLYAATKRANELMAHAYASLYGLPCTGLRFFTVYGPWGRPDMAYWTFTDAIREGRPIDLYNEGRVARDFTYVDDVVWAVTRLLATPAQPDADFDRAAPDPSASWAPHRVHNVGRGRPVAVTDMVAILEELLGRPAQRRMLPMQPGDVEETWADISGLETAVGYAPATDLREGLARFVEWRLTWPGS